VLTRYIQAALRKARYERMEEEQSYYGRIPECPGVWATGKTLEECRDELQAVLEDWLSLGLRLGHPIPEIEGIRIESAKPTPVDV
jgi:predicted RNase H-like HicB family nuclease